MPLTVGASLGAYEILAALAEGGMGQVYRARDTKLRRDVAITTLPPGVAASPDALGRFEREARLLAAINHPNICAIYGFEHAGGVHALVLELVEGPTLAEHIGRRALPVNEALSIAMQVADALDAAHTHGIVHRDLKPENIKLRDDGKVKVLDFGLAKEWIGSEAAALGNAPTAAIVRTGEATILGTPAYMSPEQARGRAVDKRTDIWAFGCVL